MSSKATSESQVSFELTPPKFLFYLEMVWMILIVTSNTLTILAVIIHRKLRNTISNFILSLCIANLLYGVSTVYRIVKFTAPKLLVGCWVCCVLHYVALLIPAFAIFFSLTAMTVDRYIAVLYPLRYPQLMKAPTVTACIAGIWTASAILGCLPLIWNNYDFGTRSSRNCTFVGVIPREYILTFIAPPAILSNLLVLYVYFRIWRIRHRHLRRISVLGGESAQISRKEIRTTITVALIVLTCVFALMPFIVVLILAAGNVHNSSLLYFIAYEVSFMNPVLTPVIYVWRNVGFKKTFQAVVWPLLFHRSGGLRERSDSTEITVSPTTFTTNT